MKTPRRDRWIGRLAWANAIAMGLVVLLGATVTATGSGFGCGESWPLCHGRFLPPLTMEGIIEYSHRVTTLASGLLLVVLLVLVAIERRQVFARWEARIVAGLLVGTLLLQSALGAAAVLAPRHPLVMAVHFGVSLTVFASALVLALVLTRGEALRRRRASGAPQTVTRGAWALLVGTYAVVYLGAYVRHSNASLACLDWPLCQGQLIPELSGATGIVFLHRLSALILTLGLLVLVVRLSSDSELRRRRGDLVSSGMLALGLLLVQSATGAWVVFSRMSLMSILGHAAVVTMLFGVLAILAVQSLPVRGDGRQVAPVVLSEQLQTSRS
ncbi:COX15/CtaA family protein [Thermomicrobium sp. CFH 73360]|uniref:COX15/CtaA family protein n=1 Tax=Thermomicrobium sp. CFH 73360 TaxID=2951987 RepID=UPI0020776D21|nr:COX15/CtaA family protein [Thermomicrobium sp. CFH 73360]MCM8747011.1 COX15/CtaA family protein [Thermomicrobium sp. CFH 73360]